MKRKPEFTINPRKMFKKSFIVAAVSVLHLIIYQGNCNAQDVPKNTLERQVEVLKLGNSSSPNIVDPLIKALKDPAPEVRFAAAWTIDPSHLHVVGWGYADGVSQLEMPRIREVIQVLLSCLSEEDPWVLAQLLDTLGNFMDFQKDQGIEPDRKAKEAFIRQTSNPDPFIRSVAIRGLRHWDKDPEREKALRRVFKDEVPMVRYSSFWAGHDGLDALTKAVQDENPRMRVSAVEYLKRDHLDDPRAVDLLIGRLQDPDGQVVSESISGLIQSKNERVVKPLLDLLKSDKQWEDSIRTAIAEITGKSLEEALRNYSPPKPHPERRLLIKQPNITNRIQRSAKGGTAERISAVLSLTWSEGPEAVDALIKALEDQAPRVRYAAAEALGDNYLSPSHYAKRVVDSLTEKLVDPDPHVRQSIVRALHSLVIPTQGPDSHSQEPFTRLSKMIQTERDPFVRLALVSSFSLSKSTVPTDTLTELLHDPVPAIRHEAILMTDLTCRPQLAETMISALEDSDPGIRMAGIQRLSTDGSALENGFKTRIKKKLKELSITDPSEKVRSAAGRSWNSFEGRLSPPENISPLSCRGKAHGS